MALSTFLGGLVQLGAVVSVDGAAIGSIVGFLCCTYAVLQVCQSSGGPSDPCHQLVDPVHHRADSVLCDLFHRRKCGVDRISEGLAGLISRHKARCQGCQSCHEKAHRIGRDHRIQGCLCQCQPCGSGFRCRIGGGHCCGGNGVGHLGRCGKGHISLIRQECRTRSSDHGRGNADGDLELGHLLVAVEEGGDHLVELHHKVAQCRKKPAGQLTGQSGQVVLQGGHPPVEGLAGLQHAVIELPALTGGGFHGGLQFVKADLAVRDAFVQGGHALAGSVADLIQRVKACVDHHVDVFQRDLLRTGHFAVSPDEGLQLVGIAKGDIAQHFQHAGGVIRRNAELQQGLGAAGQVIQREWCGSRHFADLCQLGSSLLLAAQHDLEVGQVAFHAGVVVHAALDHLAQFRCGLFCKVRDHVSGGNGPLAGALFRRVAVEPYFAGDAEICHVSTSHSERGHKGTGFTV